jgi:DNA-binding response OmpR family regulator
MQTTDKPLVMIVEDDPFIARLISLMLGKQSYRTHIAPDAETALRDLAVMRPELITLDLNLPGISGDAFLQQLRATPDIADLPVVIISAQQHIATETGRLADAALVKPFEMEDLLALVGAALARARLLATRSVGQQLQLNAIAPCA